MKKALMKNYQYFKDSELFSPNQMAYTESAFEDIVTGQDNGLKSAIAPYMTVKSRHRALCHDLREHGFSQVDEHTAYQDYYRYYGHLWVDLGLFDDRREAPPEPSHVDADRFKSIYTKDIGYEFMHCAYKEQQWWIDLLENQSFSIEQEWLIDAYEDIFRADRLERFLGIQYVGQKRFSLEGCEALIPLLERIIKANVDEGYNDVVVGMPHRGRLSTMVNVLGVSIASLVKMFSGEGHGDHSGDVKYHLGHSVNRVHKDNPYHISLAYNPSHLEAISAVVCGNVRARIDAQETRPFGILIHGDAAIAGQGVVMETLAMSQTAAYHIGGMIHIVVNNQIGFTTDPVDARSSVYCTDIAKMIGSPVLHVSADDVVSVIKVGMIAAMYRSRFKKDVFIDLVGHRKYGHNEADEPRSTQPLMYSRLKTHQGTAAIFKAALLQRGVAVDILEAIETKVQNCIKDQSSLIECSAKPLSSRYTEWTQLKQQAWDAKYSIGLTKKQLLNSAKKITTFPKDMVLQKQVEKVMLSRIAMAKGEALLNWGMAELLAYQILMDKGHSVRLVGQDVIRGTFSHRMASIYDQKTGKQYSLLKEDAGKIYNYNSILSEYAAVGFEYGYAETRPHDLVIWEAQFGDFVNGAQIIIDQFISSGYQKWQRYCHLVMLLPHGYEGQGPEHSSARIERFLQLCAEDNIQICVPSTPKQMNQLLIRQVMRSYRRPLIVFTPKSLLRHPKAVSSIDSLLEGFAPIIDDMNHYEQASRVILCSGKIYYELAAKRDSLGKNIAIIRVEQLYPFPSRLLSSVIKPYQPKSVIWCQEEPINQGAWLFIRDSIEDCLPKKVLLSVVAREASAAPAAGHLKQHQIEQEKLINDVFEEEL